MKIKKNFNLSLKKSIMLSCVTLAGLSHSAIIKNEFRKDFNELTGSYNGKSAYTYNNELKWQSQGCTDESFTFGIAANIDSVIPNTSYIDNLPKLSYEEKDMMNAIYLRLKTSENSIGESLVVDAESFELRELILLPNDNENNGISCSGKNADNESCQVVVLDDSGCVAVGEVVIPEGKFEILSDITFDMDELVGDSSPIPVLLPQIPDISYSPAPAEETLEETPSDQGSDNAGEGNLEFKFNFYDFKNKRPWHERFHKSYIRKDLKIVPNFELPGIESTEGSNEEEIIEEDTY